MELAAQFDAIAETSDDNATARWLDRAAFGFLLLMVLAAPHSIAITQGAWLLGTLAWVARLFVALRPRASMTAVGWALVALFGWTAVSAVFSYEPALSIDKLRAVAVFLIFVYAYNVIRNRRAVHFLAFALVASCMVSVAWTPIQKLIGRGVEVSQLSPDSPLAALGVREGDVIVSVNGKRVHSPQAVFERANGAEPLKVVMNRLDLVYHIEVDQQKLLPGISPQEKLGFGEWKRSSGFRAAGFYGHFTTYAEVLQLIGALAFALFVAGFMFGATWRTVLGFGVCVGGIAFALLLTVTRASQLAFMISSMSTVLLGASRKFILLAAAIAIPVSALGLYFLQQQRGVGFFDRNDGSIMWRQMMWRDGYRLLGEKPRHLVVGVGMESIKNRWMEWGFFDKGHQPIGHFHSTPLQLAAERGLPALLIWLTVLGLYARTLWRGFRAQTREDWKSRGVLLGCFASLIGFFASGIVHYNLGDQEVAMVFYILMAFGVKLAHLPPGEEILIADAPILASA